MLEKDKQRQRNQRRAMEKRREVLLQERLEKVMELDKADGGATNAVTVQNNDSKTAQGGCAGGKNSKKKKRRRRRHDGSDVGPGSVDDYDPTRADAMANDWAAHEQW